MIRDRALGLGHGSNPMTRQRSQWENVTAERLDHELLPWPTSWWRRRVSDGLLVACVADEPRIGWHLSISFRNHRGNPTRYPTWDEQVHAVRQLLPPDLTYCMMLPPDDEYVANHPSTFHWHEHRPEDRP